MSFRCLRKRTIESAVAKLGMLGSRAFYRIGPTDSKPGIRNIKGNAWIYKYGNPLKKYCYVDSMCNDAFPHVFHIMNVNGNFLCFESGSNPKVSFRISHSLVTCIIFAISLKAMFYFYYRFQQ